MSDPTESSSDFFIRLNEGTASAAFELDQRFRERLCSLVEQELGRRFARREDPEDAVQSALGSFFRGIESNRFHIDHSGGLWRLLEKITRSKIQKRIERHTAEKRQLEKEVDSDGETSFAGREPTPEDAVQTADLIDHVLQDLDEPGPTVFRMRLQGKTRTEIARTTNLTEATVRAKLDRIRDRLKRLLSEHGNDN